MNRCLTSRQRRRACPGRPGLLGALTLWPTAQAQTLHRMFPDKALRGTLVVVQPPMDHHGWCSSPASRPAPASAAPTTCWSCQAQAVGQELTVNYVLAPDGQVHDVWILTEIEAAEKRPRAADLSN